MARPTLDSYPAYYENYIALIKEDNPVTALNNQQEMIETFFSSIPEEKSNYSYAPGKWTLKTLLQHIIDTERIFTYRALSFARKEQTALPGFEENEYAEASNPEHRSWKQLCNELVSLRHATQQMIESFTEEMLAQTGISNGKPITVNAICFIIAGHFAHHKQIVESRYLG